MDLPHRLHMTRIIRRRALRASACAGRATVDQLALAYGPGRRRPYVVNINALTCGTRLETCPPSTPACWILEFRPGRLHGGSIRRARQSLARAHHRPRAGRPADDDDRRRQLARRRRRRAWGPDLMDALPKHAERFDDRDHLRSHPHGRPRARPFRLDRRQRRATRATR